MNPYEKIAAEKQLREEENKARILSLEKQLKVWQERQKELRQNYVSALDKAFVRRNLDKCDKEIQKINEVLAKI